MRHRIAGKVGISNSHVFLDKHVQYILIDALTKLAYVDECIGCELITCFDGVLASYDSAYKDPSRPHPRTQPHHAASFST